jgi:hypothetical protein
MYFGYVPKEDGRSDRAMFWMTGGESHHLSFPNFLTLCSLPDDGFARFLRDEGPLEAKRMAFMYPRNARDSWGYVKGLSSTVYSEKPSPLGMATPQISSLFRGT